MIDLSPERAAALVDAALERRHAARLNEGAGPLLAALPAEARLLGEFVLEELARLAARLDAMEAAAGAASLSREERIRLDPLSFIPRARLAAAAGEAPEIEAGPVTLDAGDPAFVGTGWWAAERTEGGSLRWSGAARWATALLPALGGGALVLTVGLRAPFGVPLSVEEAFLDGVPLAFETASSDGVAGVFTARVTVPESPPGSRVALLLGGPRHDDPATGPRRDTRRIGLGLLWARLERA